MESQALRTLFINGRFLSQRLTGVQRFAVETLSALDQLFTEDAHGFSAVVLAPKGTPAPPLRTIDFRCVGPLHGQAWEQSTLYFATRGAPLLSFGPTGPLAKRDQIVTMHDAAIYAVPAAYSPAFRAWYRIALPTLARRTPYVMTVSQFSRSELARHLGLPAERVRVSGEGWQHAERVVAEPALLARHDLRSGAYLFAVSSIAPHKNFELILRALPLLAQRDLRLVVAGGVDERLFGASALRDSSRLTRVGYVTDAELRALYEHAAAFVFPSLYEGFGLPPLEAMAFGCPVIASNRAAIPEACGDAALYFDPNNEAQLAARISELLGSPETRARLIEAGRTQLSQHSWRGAAQRYIELLCAWLAPA